MKNCEEMRALISAYLDGEADAGEKADVEKHLEECDECSEIIGELYDLTSKLRAVPELKTPENFHDEAMARLRDELNPVEIFTPGKKKGKQRKKTESIKNAGRVFKARKIPLRRVGSAAGLLVASMFVISLLGSGITEWGSKSAPSNSIIVPGSFVIQESGVSESPVNGEVLLDKDIEATVSDRNLRIVAPTGNAGISSGETFVKKYNIVIDAEDFDAVIQMIESMPGVNSDMSVEYGYYQAASITRNVSQGDYQYSKDFLRNLGTVQNESESEYRISSEIMNLESQLRAKDEEISRLLAILERSGSLSHLNAVESRIAAVTGERDNIKTQILRYNSQASNCVLNITVNYTKPSVENTDMSYFERLSNSFLRSVELCITLFGNLLVYASSALIPVIAAAVILIPILFIIRGRSEKNEK